MPKLKTKKGAAKRFKITGSGKIARKKAYHSHILTKKSAKRKRNLVKESFVTGKDVKTVKQMLPYD
jgi:large subunit ribosomal protein L35